MCHILRSSQLPPTLLLEDPTQLLRYSLPAGPPLRNVRSMNDLRFSLTFFYLQYPAQSGLPAGETQLIVQISLLSTSTTF